MFENPIEERVADAVSNDKIELHIGDDGYLQLLAKLKYEKHDWVFITGSKMMEKIGIKALADVPGKLFTYRTTSTWGAE